MCVAAAAVENTAALAAGAGSPRQPARPRAGGFSLIELLIVIVVMGILGGIVVVGVGRLSGDAGEATDRANLKMLNVASTAYRAQAPAGPGLNALPSDSARMNALFDRGLLSADTGGSRVVTPKVDGAAFVWHGESQLWLYTQADTQSYNFGAAGVLPADFKRTGTWTKAADVGFTSGGNAEALLFLPNPRSAYTYSTEATLQPPLASTQSGYGLLFNSTINASNADTGYVVQFDRGWTATGSIAIRRRTAGVESSPLTGFVFGPANSHGVVKDRNTAEGAAWWSAPHALTLVVTAIDATTRRVEFQVDGQAVFNNFTFTDTTPLASSYVGLRSWYGAKTTIGTASISGPLA